MMLMISVQIMYNRTLSLYNGVLLLVFNIVSRLLSCSLRVMYQFVTV